MSCDHRPVSLAGCQSVALYIVRVGPRPCLRRCRTQGRLSTRCHPVGIRVAFLIMKSDTPDDRGKRMARHEASARPARLITRLANPPLPSPRCRCPLFRAKGNIVEPMVGPPANGSARSAKRFASQGVSFLLPIVLFCFLLPVLPFPGITLSPSTTRLLFRGEQTPGTLWRPQLHRS